MILSECPEGSLGYTKDIPGMQGCKWAGKEHGK